MKTTQDVGRDAACYWLKASLDGKPEQINANLDILYKAAVHILGTNILNRSLEGCLEVPISIDDSLDILRKEITDEIQYLKDNVNPEDFKRID